MTATEIADRIAASWSLHLMRGARTSSPHDHVWASSWRVCDRRMVLDCLQPAPLPPFPPEVLARMHRGDDRERDLLADLMRVGRENDPPFKVIGQQEHFVLRDHKSRGAITGKVDARIEMNGTRAPLEIKAWSPFLTDRIDRFSDLFDSPWTRGGAYQLLAYLLGAGEAFGFMLLDRHGLPKLLPVELEPNLHHIEEFLVRAERVLDHLEAGTLPDYLQDDAAECRRCPWFGGVCNPPTVSRMATVLTDPDLEAALERREQLKPAADEYRDLDTDVKQRLRGVETGIIGHFSIRGLWSKQTKVELPEAVKRQYSVIIPRGRFTLDITRL